MTDVEKVRVYYAKARELVKRNEPSEARKYILGILQIANAGYKASKDIFARAKTAGFLKKWLAVSKDLYEFGVTDYVQECFGLLDKDRWLSEHPDLTPKEGTPPSESVQAPASGDRETPKKKKSKIDFDGLFDSPSEDPPRGWNPSKRAGIPDYGRMLEEESRLLDLPAEIFERVAPALVELNMHNAKAGTGFIISDKGYLLTNAHVVLGSRDAVFGGGMSFIGRRESYSVEVLHFDKVKDVALCRFDPSEVGAFSVIRFIEDYSSVKPGSFCMVAGYTNGVKLNPITGNVRDPKTATGDLSYAVPTNPGDSGGPVLNRKAECIGINKSKLESVDHHRVDQVSHATSSADILELLAGWGVTKEDLTGKGV